MVIKFLWKLGVEEISMDSFFMDNFIENRKYKRIELERLKYKEITSPCIARFRVKQYEGQEASSLEWNIVAVKNLSAEGLMFNYYKMNLGFDSLLELKIDFIKSKPTISCMGRVVRIEDAHANSMFRIAIEFTVINDLDREIINTTVEAIIKREAKKRGYSEKQMKIRAIVLDDDDAIKALVSDILRARGYDVYASSEPLLSPVYLDSECSCPVGYTCTTIIITDNNMPNMTGLEFVERQQRMGCKVQNTAVMSGGWTDEEMEHAKKLGCQVFNKPFKIDEIKKWLNECEKELDHKNKLSDVHMNQTNIC